MTLCAFPVPNFQWFSNGVPIPGATQATLRLPNCQLSMNDTIYCVALSNYLRDLDLCLRSSYGHTRNQTYASPS